MRALLRLVPSLLIASFVGAADGGTITVPDPASGILDLQDGFDAAQEGDVVLVQSGEYRGNFTVTDKPGLTIKGLGPVVVDARPLGATGSGPALVVSNCPRLKIDGVAFRNADGSDENGAGLRVSGSDDVVLKGVDVSGCAANGILAQQCAQMRVVDCVLRGNAGGLSIEGNFARVIGVTVETDRLQGIQIFGDDAWIESSRVAVIRGGGGIGIAGQRPTIRKCIVESVLDAGTNGITTSGGNPDLRGNVVSGCDVGIYVVYGANGVVKGNEIDRCSSSGLRLGGVSYELTLESNVVRRSGALGAPGIWVEGDSQLLVENRVERCAGDGIQVLSSNCVLLRNQVVDNACDGVDVDGGADSTHLDQNVVKRNGAEGIENSGTGTRLSKNVAKKNRTDFASDGTEVDEGGNDFDVVGAGAPELD